MFIDLAAAPYLTNVFTRPEDAPDPPAAVRRRDSHLPNGVKRLTHALPQFIDFRIVVARLSRKRQEEADYFTHRINGDKVVPVVRQQFVEVDRPKRGERGTVLRVETQYCRSIGGRKRTDRPILRRDRSRFVFVQIHTGPTRLRVS